MSWLRDGTLRRIQYAALVAFAVALPIGKSLAETALVISLVVWIVRTILGQRRPIIPPCSLNLFLAAWLVLAVCSMQNSVDLGASLRGLRKLIKYFGLYVLVLDTVDSERALKGVLGGCLLGLCLVSADGIWQAVVGADLIYGRPLSSTLGVSRVAATFHHPAGLAIHVASFVPLALALGLRASQGVRWSLTVLSILSVVVLLLTWNRGGLLGFLCAFALLSWWMRHWVPVVLAGCAAALQVLAMPAAIRAWAAEMPTLLHQLTQPLRLEIWQTAFQMIRAHPLVGVGTNTFVKAFPSYWAAGGTFSTIGPYAHNQYLHLAAELGITGLVVFLVLVTRVLCSIRPIVTQSGYLTDVARVGLGSGLVGYLVIGFFESSLFYSQASVIFWLLVSLIMATHAIDSRRVAPDRAVR